MCTGRIYLELEGQIGVVKPGNNITRGCAKEARIKGKEWNAFVACKMYLKRREVNVGTIELGKATIPTIINIVKEKSGTGMQKHFMPIKGQISGRCPGKL